MGVLTPNKSDDNYCYIGTAKHVANYYISTLNWRHMLPDC